MPPKKAKKREESQVQEDEDQVTSSEEESGDSDETGTSTEVVQADFEAFSLIDSDYAGVKMLLEQVLLKAPVNLGELADVIVKQANIGCVYKLVEDEGNDERMETDISTDDDVFGVVTMVDLSNNEKECIQQFKTVLRKRFRDACKKDGKTNKHGVVFEKLWGENSTTRFGWLTNERLLNIPYQISLPSFESLKTEISANAPPFDYFLVILKIHKQEKVDAHSSGDMGESAVAGKTKKRNRKKRRQADADEIIYANAEEEFLFEECEHYFDYCVSSETDGGLLGERRTEDGFYKPYRRVVVFEKKIFDAFIAKLKTHLDSTD